MSYSRSLVAVLAAVATLAVPAGAQAASVAVAGSTLTITAASGEANQLTVTPGVGTVDVLDPVTPLVPGAGCQSSGSGRVTCTAAPFMRAVVDLGDRDDTLVVGGLLPVMVTDGAGRDTVTAAAATTSSSPVPAPTATPAAAAATAWTTAPAAPP